MTTINMPSNGFTTCRFGLETNTQTFTSPLTKNVQRMTLGGARWNGAYSLPAMNRTQAAAWKAFFDLLEGQTNTFNAFDPDCKVPRAGLVGGTPLVNGGTQTGSSLITDGWPANTIVLKAGDMFSFGELKRATADVLSDGSGSATIPFKPAIRTSPADNTPIITNKPTCTMILTDDMQGIWECNKNGIYQPKTFTAFEVFN
jgi:hypothetical protein